MTPKVERLIRICERARNNIATRANEEHIYDVNGEGLFKIIAGSGSARHFRFNFLKRLGEAFYNLNYILGEAPPDEALTAEFKAYECLYNELTKVNDGLLPEFVTVPYKAVKEKMAKLSSQTA